MSLWPLGLYRVAGDSMRPTYAPGDTLLGWRWGRPRAGRVIVAQHGKQPLIKRLVRLTPGGGLWLEGDNAAASTDSRSFGPLAPRTYRATIIGRLP
jgi:phage repressor protein C with HTH and peptisase S24 domain